MKTDSVPTGVAKRYVSAQQLLDDAFRLGVRILNSGYTPSFIAGIWRGGAPVGVAIQELLAYRGIDSDHIAIRTSLYRGIDQAEAAVRVHGLGYLIERVTAADRLLIVDDVHDTGRSIQQVIQELKAACGDSMPEVRVATPYFKPGRNQTGRVPDYYLHKTEQWLVFPHELCGLSAEEISRDKPGVEALRDLLATNHRSKSARQ